MWQECLSSTQVHKQFGWRRNDSYVMYKYNYHNGNITDGHMGEENDTNNDHCLIIVAAIYIRHDNLCYYKCNLIYLGLFSEIIVHTISDFCRFSSVYRWGMCCCMSFCKCCCHGTWFTIILLHIMAAIRPQGIFWTIHGNITDAYMRDLAWMS